MPFESKAQARWAYANEDEPGQEGKAARSFIKHSHGMKLSNLPERKKDEDMLRVISEHIGRKPK